MSDIKFIDKLESSFPVNIFLWTVIIIMLCYVGLSIYHGYNWTRLIKAIAFGILTLLQPLKIVIRPFKNLLYYILPPAWKNILPIFDKDDKCLIGRGWSEKFRLSTLILFTTIAIGSLSGYVILNPNKFSSLYGRIITYILIILSLVLGFKSSLLFTHANKKPFRNPKTGKERETFSEQREILYGTVKDYVKMGVISIVVLAILGISAFFVTTNDNAARTATTIVSWIFISFGLFVGYLYSKELAITKTLLKNDLFNLIYNIVFLIPCFLLEFIQAVYNELKYTPQWTWIILLIELVIISVYILGPLINRIFYLNVYSDEVKNGGTRYKQDIKMLKKDNELKRKEIEKMKSSDAYPELTPGFFGASQQLFWKGVMDEMLWAPNEKEYLLSKLKDILWTKELDKPIGTEGAQLSEEDRKTYNDNQYFINVVQRDKWYEHSSTNFTFLDKLEVGDVAYDTKTMNTLMNTIEMISTRKLSMKNTAKRDQVVSLMMSPSGTKASYLHFDDIPNGLSTPTEKKNAIKDYLLALDEDVDYARIEYKRIKTMLDKDGGMIRYVQTQGRKMSRVYNDIGDNNQKIKLLEQRIGTTIGHPKTVMIIDKPHSLARKHKPKAGAYNSIRYGENEGGGAISEIDGDYNYDFALSSWVFLHSQPPNFYKGLSPKNILNLVGNDNVSSLQLVYDMRENTLILKTKLTNIKIPKIKLQKWINLVINYNRGNLDIFMDGELIKTLPGSVWEMGDELSLAVGENKGIRGGICNVVHFAAHLTKPQIVNNYNMFKDKDPPVA
jgi:hypothetical protein